MEILYNGEREILDDGTVPLGDVPRCVPGTYDEVRWPGVG